MGSGLRLTLVEKINKPNEAGDTAYLEKLKRLLLSPYIIFNKLFLLRNIKEVYENAISMKATRGIGRVGMGTFHKMRNSQFCILYKK